MALHFPRYSYLFNANGDQRRQAFFWDGIAAIEQDGGNLAVSSGVDVAQLRLGHQTFSFGGIIPAKFHLQITSGRYRQRNPVPA